MIIPATRIQENILCHYYYNELEGDGHIGYDQDIPEEMCKGEEVQRRFNVLYAVLGLIGCIPGNYLPMLMVGEWLEHPMLILRDSTGNNGGIWGFGR